MEGSEGLDGPYNCPPISSGAGPISSGAGIQLDDGE